MGLLTPTPTPYDPLEWVEKPLEERGRLACRAWALSGYGTPLAVYAAYAIKVLLYIGGWILFCSATPSLGGLRDIGSWWLHPVAFQKAILWSMLFELLGLGCGSGPLTGRYVPPLGGFLHFLRPGTTKLPLFRRLPLLGGHTRTWLDVGLYATLIGALVAALGSSNIAAGWLATIAVLTPLLGVADKTTFLAARAEHYWTTVVCLLFTRDWIAGAQAVQLALWFWAGVSKLNHHFPAVVCVMASNSPVTRFAWLRKLAYRNYPHDLRPSALAVIMAHLGTLLELSVPLVFLLASHNLLGAHGLVLGTVLMLLLHGYITSNVPMGVPIEWNFMVVYGGFALFWAHPNASVLSITAPPLVLFLVVMLVAVPLIGNLFPEHLSFLLSMRYYAGNWAYSVWLFRGEKYRKLDQLKKSSPWIYDQLAHFYDRATAIGLVGKVLAFRMMHLHGRVLSRVIPKAVDHFEDYEYLDGEIVAGLVLGWNFGDGHLHNEQLLEAVQAQCGFSEGELRCVFVESQPLFRGNLSWRIVDAHKGELMRGSVAVEELRRAQPWGSPSRLTPSEAATPGSG